MSVTFHVTILTATEITGAGLKHLLAEAGLAADHVPIDRYKELDFSSLGEAHVLLVDALPDEAGLELCAELRRMLPAARIALFSESCLVADIQKAFASGLNAVLLKTTRLGALQIMLRLIADGENLIPSHLVAPLAAMVHSAPVGDTVAKYADLSAREAEILNCLVDGDSNKAIARRLSLAEATVKVHIKGILAKLNLLNRTQAAIWALKARYEHDGCRRDSQANCSGSP